VTSPGDDAERLAVMLHEELCGDLSRCGRWDSESSGHRQYYHGKAHHIIQRLEPEIGIANVFTAARVILGELT